MTAPRVSDKPSPGHYLLRLVRGGPWVAAEISLGDDGWTVMIDGAVDGPAHDPWSLPNMERVHFYGRPTTIEDAQYRIGRKRWAEIYAPHDPAANPTKRIDLDRFTPI
jgi:hypothetical protein